MSTSHAQQSESVSQSYLMSSHEYLIHLKPQGSYLFYLDFLKKVLKKTIKKKSCFFFFIPQCLGKCPLCGRSEIGYVSPFLALPCSKMGPQDTNSLQSHLQQERLWRLFSSLAVDFYWWYMSSLKLDFDSLSFALFVDIWVIDVGI